MNERHYGVAMLGWVSTHSSEIESYSANGGLHQMTSSKIQKLFLFLSRKTNVSIAQNYIFAQIVQPGSGKLIL